MALSAFTARTLTELSVSGWRQFDDVEIIFHDRMTIITGQNGAGKTTLLHILGNLVGWSIPLASTPSLHERFLNFASGIWRRLLSREARDELGDRIGLVRFEVDAACDVFVRPRSDRKTFEFATDNGAKLYGLYIPSHRPLFVPTPATSIRRKGLTRQEVFEEYVARSRPQWTGERRTAESSPLAYLKTALGLIRDPGNDGSFSVEAFEQILHSVLPESLGFQRLAFADAEPVLETTTGTFGIDAASGGVAALIDIVWQLFAFAPPAEQFVAIIDEPENHLHPEMQRTILPNLMNAFPHVQFVISTHSPLVVTSTKRSRVYALAYDEPRESRVGINAPPEGVRRCVHAFKLDEFERAGTANDTLRKVLGLDYTMPDWAAQEIEASLNEFVDEGMTDDALDNLERRLEKGGLTQYIPKALVEAGSRMQQSASTEDVLYYQEAADADWNDRQLPPQAT